MATCCGQICPYAHCRPKFFVRCAVVVVTLKGVVGGQGVCQCQELMLVLLKCLVQGVSGSALQVEALNLW